MTLELITACLATVAGIVIGASPLLQAKRVLDVRDGSSISLPWLYVIVIGDSVWMLRGLATGDTPIIIANVISLIALSATIAVVRRHRTPPALVPAEREQEEDQRRSHLIGRSLRTAWAAGVP
jgi:MtN3 and saliva related transmembrane protein